MLTRFFDRKDMERVIEFQLNAYKIALDDVRQNRENLRDTNLSIDAALFGAYVFTQHHVFPLDKKLTPSVFLESILKRFIDIVKRNGEISFEEMCFCTASLLGDFADQAPKIGNYFGKTARKLGLGTSIFKKNVADISGLEFFGRMTIMNLLSPNDKSIKDIASEANHELTNSTNKLSTTHYPSGREKRPKYSSTDTAPATPRDMTKVRSANYERDSLRTAQASPHSGSVTIGMHSGNEGTPFASVDLKNFGIKWDQYTSPINLVPTNRVEKKDPASSEVLVVNVMARAGTLIDGNDLLQALLRTGLRFGELNIFHKHNANERTGRVLFSVANAANSGTFDLNRIGDFKTIGVTFFMTTTHPSDSEIAFELMLDAAKQVQAALDADLMDEHRNILTPEEIQLYYQRIHNGEMN